MEEKPIYVQNHAPGGIIAVPTALHFPVSKTLLMPSQCLMGATAPDLITGCVQAAVGLIHAKLRESLHRRKSRVTIAGQSCSANAVVRQIIFAAYNAHEVFQCARDAGFSMCF